MERKSPSGIAKKARPLLLGIRDPFEKKAMAERRRAGEKAPEILRGATSRLSRSGGSLTIAVSLHRGNDPRSDPSIKPVLAGRRSRARPTGSRLAVTRVISVGGVSRRKKAEPGGKEAVRTKANRSRRGPTKDGGAMSDRSAKNGSPSSNRASTGSVSPHFPTSAMRKRRRRRAMG